ncbi:MAG: cyclic nucleotide-binding protein [Acidobacteria bacterium]|jgi:CRP-like cAMP-binding protein|nr:cyclic nucleotide-binding protein [Acidobacteriota bacterium]
MTTIARRIELLGRVPLFSGVAKGTLRSIAGLGREIVHGPGLTIVQEGATAHALHVIVEGEAIVRIGGRAMGRLRPGDFFGEIAVLDKGTRSATVSAETRVVTLAIEGTALRHLVESDGKLAHHLLVHLAGKVRELDRQLLH